MSRSTAASVKTRQALNPMDQATLTVNEKILRECNLLYTDPERGLVKLAEQFNLKLLAPRKKITVLLIGNHSAGKSSFINWYIEEHVQKTGVAIETQGFVIVTSGKRRETLMGNATLQLYPHLKPISKISGVVDFLTTEISTSKQKKFNLVTFVDTPGLVDGDMQYHFDVNEAIIWLGKMADLVFVFFDPIGQALCHRTLSLVERLNANHTDKIRFYLSKADDAGTETDRQKVMMQIVQELCKRPGLNRTGFDMPTIFIPSLNKPTKCSNQIDEVCREIEKTINQTVQNALNSLGKDCESIQTLTKDRLKLDNDACQYNRKATTKGLMFAGVASLLPMLLILHIGVSLISEQKLASYLGSTFSSFLLGLLLPARVLWSMVPSGSQIATLLVLLTSSAVLGFVAKWSLGKRPTLNRRAKQALQDTNSYIETVLRPRKEQLYREYLEQSVAEYDL